MARVIGQAGRGAAVEAIAGAGEPVFIGIGVLIVLLVASTIIRGPLGWTAVFVGLAIDVVVLRRSLAEIFEHAIGSRAWWRGYEGERLTGAELAKLPDNYVVFHDFSFHDGDDWHDWNLDHIVVGPTGVFVLETKNSHRETVRSAKVDGRTQKDVRQAQRNAVTLKDRLKKWSNGQLADVFVEGWVVYAQDPHVDELWEDATHVVPLRLLGKEIQRRSKRDVDWDQAFRVVEALCSQTYPTRQAEYRGVLRAIEQDHAASRRERRDQKERAGIASSDAPVEKDLCPVCNAPLVVKTAHRGRPDEHEFLSCSRFPKCKFGRNLEPAAPNGSEA